VANLAIVLLDTAQPYILASGVDAIATNAAYAEIAKAIFIPVVVIASPFLVFPLLREIYTARHFRPQLRKHLSLLCLRSGARTSAFNDRGPTAQRGRDVIVPLVDSFLRDPFYIARGAVLLVILTWMSPVLGLFLFGGMALDGLITLVMEIRLNPLYQEIRKIELRINSLEYVLHDHEARDLSEDMELLWELRVAWDEFAVLTRTAETQRLIFQSVLREGVALLVRLGMMLLVGWWVHIGYATITEYIFFTTIVTRANDPLVVLLNLQQVVMQEHAVLWRFGILSGVKLVSG
jgi:ABC-type bacteriocin/lantibiotic exporter with double-glycine peptidase domain